jgi:hypothetical protein
MSSLGRYYQTDYLGESVITKVVFKNGAKEETREWVSSTFSNTKHNGIAHVIGNGKSRQGFNLNLLREVHGGLLAKGMGQTYGCNALYRDFAPDFLVVTGQSVAHEIAPKFPNGDTIGVTWSKNLLAFPEKYHLVPYNVRLTAGAAAAYLACFHGHTKIYLLGFDTQLDPRNTNNIYINTAGYPTDSDCPSNAAFIKDLKTVMDVYDDVEFIRVMPRLNSPIPEDWKWCKNFSQITYQKYISLCDLGSALHYLKK